jgi:hypothetical protein
MQEVKKFTSLPGEDELTVLFTVSKPIMAIFSPSTVKINEGLLKLLEPLKIPVLSANVIPDKNSILYNKWKPYDIFTVDGVIRNNIG